MSNSTYSISLPVMVLIILFVVVICGLIYKYKTMDYFEFYLAVISLIYALYLLYHLEQCNKQYGSKLEDIERFTSQQASTSSDNTIMQKFSTLPNLVKDNVGGSIGYLLSKVVQEEGTTEEEEVEITSDYYREHRDSTLENEKHIVDEEAVEKVDTDYTTINVFLTLLKKNLPEQYMKFVSQFRPYPQKQNN